MPELSRCSSAAPRGAATPARRWDPAGRSPARTWRGSPRRARSGASDSTSNGCASRGPSSNCSPAIRAARPGAGAARRRPQQIRGAPPPASRSGSPLMTIRRSRRRGPSRRCHSATWGRRRPAGPAERDEACASLSPELVAHLRRRAELGLNVTALAETERGRRRRDRLLPADRHHRRGGLGRHAAVRAPARHR